jgi:poly(hydroxyalkanoate) depolymerase family esterase
MSFVDWQDLYAANRAVIEGAIPGAAGMASPAMPPSSVPAALPPMRLPEGPREPAGPTPGGSGTWERLDAIAAAQGREAFVYTPRGLSRDVPAPVVVMLHGCTQTAASFAAGTLMNATADRHGFVVVHPQQSREHNQQGCWNWFSTAHQTRGGGEPAFIASTVRAVLGDRARWATDETRVFVAGLSAGGAMAGVMAATHPGLFAAAAVHSGLAYGCARGIPAALSAMTRGGPDPEQQGRAALAAMGADARVVPVISIHGDADTTVCPVNGEQVLRQWMTTNRLASAGAYDPDPARPAATSRDGAGGGRAYTRRTWTDASGALVQEHIEIHGMGHAWSGGAAGGSYTDPRGPGASELIWSFFDRVGPATGRPARGPVAEPCTGR